MNLRLEEHNFFVDATYPPKVTIETIGDFEFEGNCHLVIKKVS